MSRKAIIFTKPLLILVSSSPEIFTLASKASHSVYTKGSTNSFRQKYCAFSVVSRSFYHHRRPSLLESGKNVINSFCSTRGHHSSINYFRREKSPFLSLPYSSSSESNDYDKQQQPKNDKKCKKQTIHVVSYNLLSSHLAEPSYHTKCNPQHLAAENRLPKILDKLQAEIDKQQQISKDGFMKSSSSSTTTTTPVVFCLQEVSHDWAKHLHVFFAEREYHFITASYGKASSGYMGIGTAYPIQHFKTLEVDICRLSDTREWPTPREGIDDIDQPGLITKYLFNSLVNTARYFGFIQQSKPNSSDPWEKSQYRHNQFIAVMLQQKYSVDNDISYLQPIWIGNYHMPCAFRDPAVMTIHCDLVAHRIQSLASDDKDSTTTSNSGSHGYPFVLAGDFNILPDSPQYQFLTKGTLPHNDDENNEINSSTNSPLPQTKYGIEWKSSCTKMKSAYATFNEDGKEPDYTNYASGEISDESFIGTLDYIFVSDEHDWAVKDVVSLKHRIDVENGPYPNEDEPSDHVLIAATLEV